jgi:hypothetical protein
VGAGLVITSDLGLLVAEVAPEHGQGQQKQGQGGHRAYREGWYVPGHHGRLSSLKSAWESA